MTNTNQSNVESVTLNYSTTKIRVDMSQNKCSHDFVIVSFDGLEDHMRDRLSLFNLFDSPMKFFKPKKCADCGKRVKCHETLESYYVTVE